MAKDLIELNKVNSKNNIKQEKWQSYTWLHSNSKTTRITLDGLLRGKITIMLKIKKFSNPF